MLGYPAEERAWILLRLEDPNGRRVPIALRTGPVLTVGPLRTRQLTQLPPGVTLARRGVLEAAFEPTKGQSGMATDIMTGFRLNLAKLFTAADLHRSEQRLSLAAKRS